MKSDKVDLFLLRHGIAEEINPEIEDSSRNLTKEGRKKVGYVIDQLKQWGFEADQIFSSPYSRARETAEIALQKRLGKRLKIIDELKPSGSIFPLLKDLTGKNLFVGHEPCLTALTSVLINSSKNSIVLKKAGFIHLNWSKSNLVTLGTAKLECLIKPSMLINKYLG
tara:strand:+ start:10468 stop:10968 length:501 start_codon:yes stop_codon:yes gene_type:complete